MGSLEYRKRRRSRRIPPLQEFNPKNKKKSIAVIGVQQGEARDTEHEEGAQERSQARQGRRYADMCVADPHS